MRTVTTKFAQDESYLHISSLIVQLHPHTLSDVYEHINAFADSTVYKGDRDDKLIVVLEATQDSRITEVMSDVLSLPGVLSVNLVYQHCESADSLNERL